MVSGEHQNRKWNWHLNTTAISPLICVSFQYLFCFITPGINEVRTILVSMSPDGSMIFIFDLCMMTSSNGNIFRITGPLCGEYTGPGDFPTQRPVTRSFGVFFDLRLNKRLSKQPWGWWFETPSWSLSSHCNGSWKVLMLGCTAKIIFWYFDYMTDLGIRTCSRNPSPKHSRVVIFKVSPCRHRWSNRG